MFRTFALASLLCAGLAAPAAARDLLWEDADAPVLRADVVVTTDLVRIGDLVENAGTAARVAVFRAPDPGTTGSVPTERIVAALRAHQVIGVETKDIREVSVTRAARTLASKDIERAVAQALERRNGLGEAANLTLTFDRDLRTMQLDPGFRGEMQVASVRYEPRGARFDIAFEIAADAGAPARLRFTGTAVETLEVAIPVRTIERGEVIKGGDIVLERRPKAEVGADAVPRERALGMQARRAIRAGQPLRPADIGKPDVVQRDQFVSIVYEQPGLYLTMRGKAMEGGAEGDTVTITNLQSKRTVQGVVIGPGQVSIAPVTPRLTATAAVALADAPSSPPAAARKAE